jgi:hypothetical protein
MFKGSNSIENLGLIIKHDLAPRTRVKRFEQTPDSILGIERFERASVRTCLLRFAPLGMTSVSDNTK